MPELAETNGRTQGYREAGKRALWGAGSAITDSFSELPLGTVTVIACCSLLQIVSFFVNLNASGCLDPAHFLAAPIRNLPRLFGNQFLHGGLLHLAFNAVPFAGLGKQLERNVGSFQFMHLIFILTLIGSLIHVLLGAVVGLFASSWAGCSVGLGGLIFAFFTIEANTESRIFTPRRIASWTIPGAVYPFIALIIIAVLTAGASFLSHLAGILAGEFYSFGLLDFLKLPQRVLTALQNARIFSFISDRDNFISASSIALPFHDRPSIGSSGEGRSLGLWGRLRDTFNSRKYATVNNQTADDEDNDPLLWEDEDLIESSADRA